MSNYTNGKIYKIINDSSDKVYIGSTVRKYLSDRFRQHRWESKQEKGCKSRLILEGTNPKIILIESYPCKSKDELHARERYWIEQFKDKCVNMMIPTRTKKEYYKENIQWFKNHHKKHYSEHQEEYVNRSKKWYEDNHDKALQRNREYQKKNKEQIKEQANQKFVCECGKRYTQTNKKRHTQSKHHQEFVSKN